MISFHFEKIWLLKEIEIFFVCMYLVAVLMETLSEAAQKTVLECNKTYLLLTAHFKTQPVWQFLVK